MSSLSLVFVSLLLLVIVIQKDKYILSRFGTCPRVGCNKQRVLPVGLSDDLQTHRVRIYCPKCQECYEARGTTDERE